MRRKDLYRIVALFHHRWGVPILVELHRSSGSKFVTLANRLGISRDSLSNTLQTLIRHEWVMRNPGHGHPMRPEYVLTKAGAKLAPWCARLTGALRKLGIEYATLRKWSIPAIIGLGTGMERFSELRDYLATSTARALTQTLKDLQTAGLIERVVTDAYPPTTRYRLTKDGRKLAPLIGGR